MPSEQLQRWLSTQIVLTEREAAETPETPTGKPMSPAKAMFSGVAYGLKLAQQFYLNGLAIAAPFQSALALPCGRAIGTEAPMPDGETACSCGQVHVRQPLAENAAPWMVATHAPDRIVAMSGSDLAKLIRRSMLEGTDDHLLASAELKAREADAH